MFFSILVPVYNSEPYLKDCIESVLRQTEQDYELILVNDGSTDNSGVLCDRYRALHPDRIRVKHQINHGLIGARRVGVALAGGDYCLFLDADDTFEPDCLAIVHKTIEETGADLVIFNYCNRYEGGQSAVAEPVFADGSVFRGEEKRAVYDEMIASWRLNNLCTKCIKTQLVQADDTPYAAYLDNPYTEDLLQSLYPVTHAACIAYLAKPLYNYRRIGESISSRVLTGKIDRQFNDAVMDKLRACMTDWGMDDPARLEKFHARRLNGLITLFWQHYHAADSEAAQREVLAYPWQDHLNAEDRLYVGSRAMSMSHRLQLAAILSGNKRRVDLIARLAELKAGVTNGD